MRSGISLAIALFVTALVPGLIDMDFAPVDRAVLALIVDLVCYSSLTTSAFTRTSPQRLRSWARREGRGSLLQRYVFGTAPGPGASVLIAFAAMAVAVFWLPSDGGVGLPHSARLIVAVILAAVAWVGVVISFAVAYHADDVLERGAALEFPGAGAPTWTDYVYFSLSVMTTFGTTDVNVRSTALRRTISVHAVIAFAFNTITVATLVTAIGRL